MKSSAKTGPNHDSSRKVMEKISQTEIRHRHLHQTHFTSGHRRRQKTRNSKGFCEDNLPSVNVRAEQSREGRIRPCLQFRYTPLPGRHTILTCLPKSMVIAVPTHAPPAVIKPDIQFHQKEDAAKKGCILI